ncbi:MAG: DEAD/DEAH box helicase [Actinomycetota bacterium]
MSTLPRTQVSPGIPGVYLPLIERLRQGPPLAETESRLVEQAVGVWARPGFDTFVSLPRLRFEPFDYQMRAAEAALRRMRGRAILADEVGLGKTIEACLVLAELRARGLAGRTLILTPVGLLEQWQEELDRKFALPSVVAGSGPLPSGSDIVLASLATARRTRLRKQVCEVGWDLVIVDEAHRLKNPASASSKLVRALRTRNLLLLTATPVENRLDDLFQLVSLVSPGLLGTPKEFRARYAGESDKARTALRSKMRDVMVRHRRSEVALMLPRRVAETIRVLPANEESDFYRRVSERVREEGRDSTSAHRLALRSLLRLAGSSPAATAPLLDKLGWHDLSMSSRDISMTEKARVALGLMRDRVDRGDKLVVFTAFRQTLDFLTRLAAGEGLPIAAYHGSLTRGEKEGAIARFRGDCPLLITTEAAGEGRNLQFCHIMLNFDLPWNPMQIEQRLGRIHRIGQEREVLLTNLVSRGTIEERILRVLEAKINLFELVVGELDMILGRVEDEFDFESFVFHSHVDSSDDREFAARLESLGESLAEARKQYLAGRGLNDALVDDAGAVE